MWENPSLHNKGSILKIIATVDEKNSDIIEHSELLLRH
jgi:hypothetical protein